MSSARGNYKAYFNAFDENVQQPKIPDNQVLSSAGIKARDTYVLRCRDLLSPEPGNPTSLNHNVLIYFHPGLSQNFYVMAYRYINSSLTLGQRYGIDWRILKVGNNGCPFKIRQAPTTYPAHFGDVPYKVEYVDESNLNIKSARIVSSGLRIFNVGLQVADVLEIKQDHRLPVVNWANLISGNWNVVKDDPLLREMIYQNIMSPWHYRTNGINWAAPNQDYHNYHKWQLNGDVLNGNLSWEDAPYHLVTPSGSIRGLQINAVSTTDNRQFRTWNNLVSTNLQMVYHSQSAATDRKEPQFLGFTEAVTFYEAETDFVTPGVHYYYASKFYPTSENDKILDFIADPDFLGTWIKIIQPNEELELLIECVTNYEIMCYPNSIYYTFQTYNEKLPVSIQDVRNMVEESYGNMFAWDVDSAKDVSRSIEGMLSNIKSFGNTTGRVVTDSNYMSLRQNTSDATEFEDFLNRLVPSADDDAYLPDYNPSGMEYSYPDMNTSGRPQRL